MQRRERAGLGIHHHSDSYTIRSAVLFTLVLASDSAPSPLPVRKECPAVLRGEITKPNPLIQKDILTTTHPLCLCRGLRSSITMGHDVTHLLLTPTTELYKAEMAYTTFVEQECWVSIEPASANSS
jgi:hypothetical protein